MVSGDRSLAEGKRGAFYNTLEEFHKYWDRIDIICPKIQNPKSEILNKSKIRNSKPIPYTLNPIPFFDNVFIHPSPWPLLLQPFWILKKGREIYREQKFNLMTVHEYPPFYNGIGARLLWHKIKVPYILEIMHIPGYPKAANAKEKIYKTLLKFFIKPDSSKAKAIRVINKNQAPGFLIKAGVAKDKLIYIPAFYIDLNIFQPLGIAKKYDLVFTARLEKNKGITLLLRAISNIKVQIPNVRLLIIGSGPLKAKLQDYVKRNDLGRNVFFSGWLGTADNVALAYNSAKIFINPSFNEGGPRVVLEAMACGLPVITTRVGLMPDIIKDGENGLFTGWEPQEIAEKIIYLLNGQETQAKFSSAGLETVKQFEKIMAVKNFADELKKLIK